MGGRDVFSELADLAADVRAMRDDCDKVADVLRTVAALLREAAARPRPQHRPLPTGRSRPALAFDWDRETRTIRIQKV